jgi:fatty acid desaturase
MIPAWLLVMYTTGFWGKMAGAIALGWFWQQCGWLAHDFLHHAVVKSNRTINDCFGLLVGNIYLGFSVDWWKNKHNTHHR